jgi:hypothetical protein
VPRERRASSRSDLILEEILARAPSSLASALMTIAGSVFDALIIHHPSSTSTLTPSIGITLSPSASYLRLSSSTTLNFRSSGQGTLCSGEEWYLGSEATMRERGSPSLDIAAANLRAA